MNKQLWLIPSALLLAGCNLRSTPTSNTTPFEIDNSILDEQRAFTLLEEFVKITPRHSGHPGAKQAAEWIAANIEPFVDDVRIDSFEDKAPDGPMTFHNVIATLRGTSPSQTLILGGHFDTKYGISDTFQGANDSGSSTALLIELARVLQQNPRLPFNIEFTFFDGEECRYNYSPIDGLHGSRHRVAQLKNEERLDQIVAVLILDMIGDKDLNVTIPRNVNRELLRLAFDAAHAEGYRAKFSLARMAIIDDHVPFGQAGIPVMNFIDFEHGSAPGKNDYWHTENDSLDNVSAASLAITGKVTLRLLQLLANR